MPSFLAGKGTVCYPVHAILFNFLYSPTKKLFKVIETFLADPNFFLRFKICEQGILSVFIKTVPAKIALIKVCNAQFPIKSSMLKILI